MGASRSLRQEAFLAESGSPLHREGSGDGGRRRSEPGWCFNAR